jgi:hypothetical protein
MQDCECILVPRDQSLIYNICSPLISSLRLIERDSLNVSRAILIGDAASLLVSKGFLVCEPLVLVDLLLDLLGDLGVLLEL